MPTNIVIHYRRTYHLYQILEVKTTKLLELLRPKTTLEGGKGDFSTQKINRKQCDYSLHAKKFREISVTRRR